MNRSASMALFNEEDEGGTSDRPRMRVFNGNLEKMKRSASLKMDQQARRLARTRKSTVANSSGSGPNLLNRVRSVLIRSESGIKKGLARSLSTKSFRRKSDVCSNSNNLDFGANDKLTKKERYFSEKQDKNIFMKLIYPSYHKRNQWFRKLFVEKGQIDENETYLASYSCAYQREILAQGRMFISQSHVCFYANIFGWETNLVIPMADIKAITKQKAAFIFPNSIQIEKSNGEKMFFASFVNRDKSFQILETVMERNAEGKKMTPEEVWELLNKSEEKSPSIPPSSPPSSMTVHHTRSGELPTKINSVKLEKDNCSQTSSLTSDYVEEEILDDAGMSTIEVADECSTSSHTDIDPPCPCAEHTGRLIMDKVFACSVQQFYTLNFTENPWFKKLIGELKAADYAATVWTRDKTGLETRSCTYSVALNHAMAPKAVIVNERQVLTHFPRPEDGIIVFKETQNSGVPYSDNFLVQITYCVSRVGQNNCRVKVHGGVHYKKGVWSIVRGYIEKGTHQGLDEHYRTLEKLLNEECDRLSRTSSEKEPSSSSSQLRHRRTHLKDSPKVNDVVARAVESTSSSIAPSIPPIGVQNVKNTVDYSWHLSVLIIVLSLFLISNFWILSRFQKSASTTAESQLRPLIQSLMSEIERLQEQVTKLNSRSDL